jgi:nucleoside-diphosphate-sugar epimerase
MLPRKLFESVLYNKVVKKYGNGQAIRDWLYVEDAARGVLAALFNVEQYSIFNFGTGVGTTVNELIRMVVEITGRELNIVFEDVPPGDAVFAGLCDNRKAKRLLGWEPKIDLRTGLKLMYEYMKKESVKFHGHRKYVTLSRMKGLPRGARGFFTPYGRSE